MIELTEELKLALEADDRERLEQIIEQADPDDYEALRELVRDPGTAETHRRRALYALGKWPDREDDVVELISSILPDLAELERITAVSTLGRIGSSKARQILIDYRDDEAPDVRRQVVISLARNPEERTVEVLKKMAQDDDSEIVRNNAQKAVEQLDR